MSEHDQLSATEERAGRLVRNLRTPEADPIFRTRLRESFVSGKLADPVLARPPLPAPGESPWRMPAVRWAVAAAAVVAVVVAGTALNRPPEMRLLEADGVGVAIVDGRPVVLTDEAQLAAVIRPGSRVRVPDGASISIASRGQMALELAGGTDAVIPKPPGRWFGRESYAEVNHGILRITTGRDFKGARLHVETPAADVEVNGTTLAVICEPTGTCVCVLDGHVHVGPQGGEMLDVEAGRRRFVFLDGTDENAEMRETEAVSLAALRDARRVEMGMMR